MDRIAEEHAADERHSDPVDQGSFHAERARRIQESMIRAAVAPMQHKDANGQWETEECDDCGEEIGLERLEVTGTRYCIVCATKRERKAKGL